MLKGRYSGAGLSVDEGGVWLTCIAALFSAWAYGGAEEWAIWTLLVVAVSASALLLGRRAHGPDSRMSQEWGWMIPALLLLMFLIVQAVNPSHVYAPLDQGLTARQHIAWLPTSADAPSTRLALAYLVSLMAIFLGVRSLQSQRGLFVLIGTIVLSAAAMACLSLLQGSGRERWELVGRFLNENSFASYTNCVLPVTLGAAQALRREAVRRHQRSNPGVLLYFLAGLMATAVLLSGSRAGALITVLILVSWLVLAARDLQRSSVRGGWLQLVLPILPITALLATLGVDILVREARLTDRLLGGQILARTLAIHGTWRMFLDAPFFGIGAGAFHAAFPYYQDQALHGFYRHAHNDVVQWVAEVGVLGAGLGAAALTGVVRMALRGERGLPPAMARGMALALMGVAVHSCIDFPFRIPAISVVAVVWLGCLSRSLSGRRERI